MLPTKGFRLHIGIFGRRNVGKSSLLNAFTNQEISIVSEMAGTTTDPVEKAIEVLPIGPCQIIDTAGIDDEGFLGSLRVEKTKKIFDRTDLALLVTAQGEWTPFEDSLLKELESRRIPFVVVNNKDDLPIETSSRIPRDYINVSSLERHGILELKRAILDILPKDFWDEQRIVGDIVKKGETVILVIPIDKEAPRGRIILPQVQAIRELLDNEAITLVVKETELAQTFRSLRHPPQLVVTDSQAFAQVAYITPASVPLTSFSILFARFKGDLRTFVEGAKAIDRLRSGDRVAILESCSHHPIENDIGRHQIPNLLANKAGGPVRWETFSGHQFPENIGDYKLAIHCGACMTNRKEVLSRILHCQSHGVPITNYGITTAHCNGTLERT